MGNDYDITIIDATLNSWKEAHRCRSFGDFYYWVDVAYTANDMTDTSDNILEVAKHLWPEYNKSAD
jgi:hypothetical protein